MSAIQELLALLNTANSTTYTEAQVSFGNPTAVAGAEAGQPNAKITVSGKEDAGYTGSKELSYIRLDLTKTFEGHALTSKGPETGGKLQEVLDDIFTATGVRIEAEDLTNSADVDFTQAKVVLTAKGTSVKWTGTVEVATSTDLRNIEPSITTTTLPGFEYPTIA